MLKKSHYIYHSVIVYCKLHSTRKFLFFTINSDSEINVTAAVHNSYESKLQVIHFYYRPLLTIPSITDDKLWLYSRKKIVISNPTLKLFAV